MKLPKIPIDNLEPLAHSINSPVILHIKGKYHSSMILSLWTSGFFTGLSGISEDEKVTHYTILKFEEVQE